VITVAASARRPAHRAQHNSAADDERAEYEASGSKPGKPARRARYFFEHSPNPTFSGRNALLPRRPVGAIGCMYSRMPRANYGPSLVMFQPQEELNLRCDIEL